MKLKVHMVKSLIVGLAPHAEKRSPTCTQNRPAFSGDFDTLILLLTSQVDWPSTSLSPALNMELNKHQQQSKFHTDLCYLKELNFMGYINSLSCLCFFFVFFLKKKYKTYNGLYLKTTKIHAPQKLSTILSSILNYRFHLQGPLHGQTTTIFIHPISRLGIIQDAGFSYNGIS